jgi:hypothetical protein
MNKQFKRELKYIIIVVFFIVYIIKCFDNLKPVKRDWVLSSVVKAEEVTPTPTPKWDNQYQQEIYKVFGKDAPTAYAIARAESNLKPDKCHIDDIEYSCGIFQINLRAHNLKVPGETMEEKAEWLKDYKNNVITARFIYATSGFRAWSVFKNKNYLNYL